MENTRNKIGILGCGWLGFPVAQRLLEAGYQVKGSTTTRDKVPKLLAAGIEAFEIRVLPNGIKGDLLDFLEGLETLVIDFPPGIRSQPAADYIAAMAGLIYTLKASSVKHILFVSSISVYEEIEAMPQYSEEDPANAVSERGRALIVVEDMLKSENSFKTTVLRLGGLIGPDRHPVNQLSGRKGISNGEAPINLIHQEDCIGVILKILKGNIFGEIFNAVFPDHPSKKQYYQTMAKARKLPLPEFEEGVPKGKIIHSTKVQEVLGYRFKADLHQ